MRADAARNRQKIVEVARVLFRERGYDVPLDDIAKAAGVGPGTLYRHFPNRDSLIDAVMQAWVDRVQASVDETLTEGGDARAMLLRWFGRYVALITLHKGGAAKITGAMDDETSPIMTKCQVLRGANQQVIDTLSGDLRPGVDSLQMARLVGGVATVADASDLPRPTVDQMLEVIADGLLR
ncbi:MAG: helix-turn-helix domain-containing protein [Nocardioidaceae bacterium]